MKFATASPFCVYRSSGSEVRLPTTVMIVSPASDYLARGAGRRAAANAGGALAALRAGLGRRAACRGDGLLGAEHLGAQHGLGQAELAVELLRRRLVAVRLTTA